MRSLVVMAVTMLLLATTAASADAYDYALDRFEADGNLDGPMDGTPDLVDEFDDGVMGPVFAPTAGSVIKLKVVRGSLAPVVGPVRVALCEGTGPVNSCDGFVGDAGCLASASRAKCSTEY